MATPALLTRTSHRPISSYVLSHREATSSGFLTSATRASVAHPIAPNSSQDPPSALSFMSASTSLAPRLPNDLAIALHRGPGHDAHRTCLLYTSPSPRD